jgi:hypothetical protein
MSEADLWSDIQKGMLTRWHAQRHEDKHSTGIPDVSFGIQKRSDGWIELKFLKRLPDFNGKPWDFKYDHFTPDQRNWLETRTKHGTGRVFLMCRFGPDLTVVWNWNRVRLLLGQAPLETIIKAGNAQWWHSPIDFAELAEVLANNRIIQPRFQL